MNEATRDVPLLAAALTASAYFLVDATVFDPVKDRVLEPLRAQLEKYGQTPPGMLSEADAADWRRKDWIYDGLTCSICTGFWVSLAQYMWARRLPVWRWRRADVFNVLAVNGIHIIVKSLRK